MPVHAFYSQRVIACKICGQEKSFHGNSVNEIEQWKDEHYKDGKSICGGQWKPHVKSEVERIVAMGIPSLRPYDPQGETYHVQQSEASVSYISLATDNEAQPSMSSDDRRRLMGQARQLVSDEYSTSPEGINFREQIRNIIDQYALGIGMCESITQDDRMAIVIVGADNMSPFIRSIVTENITMGEIIDIVNGMPSSNDNQASD